MYFLCFSWHGSNVEGLPADPLSLSEEFPNPEALYRSLDMLTDDMSSADCQNANRGIVKIFPIHITFIKKDFED